MQPLTDLMSGRIDLMVDTITVTGAAVKAGTLRGLGVTSLVTSSPARLPVGRTSSRNPVSSAGKTSCALTISTMAVRTQAGVTKTNCAA